MRTMLASLMSVAASAQTSVPLQPGHYVLSSASCEMPAFAEEMSFDGRNFADPHDSRCTTRIVSHRGSTYRISTTCRAEGDGTPAKPTTEVQTLKTLSRTAFTSTGGTIGTATYRLCPKLRD